MKSQHPFQPFIPINSTKLIIGTIPPPRFCKEPYHLLEDDVNFYYGSRDNHFWPLLEEVFKTKFEYLNNSKSNEQRQKLLESLNIGITDIIEICYHENNQASDDKLKEIEYKDLRQILIDFPSIDTLIYTSEFVKKLVNDYFKTYHSKISNNPKEQSIKINGKLYKVHILYSPSPLALRNMGDNGVDKRKKQYREVLTST